MVSVGACVIGDPDRRFYAELQEISPHWDPGAEAVHKLSRAHLRVHGEDPERAMEAFSKWVRGVAGEREAVFCATPIRYDWVYVEWYLRNYEVFNPFMRTLDGRQLYRQLKGLPTGAEVPRMRIWTEFPTALPHTHNALDDALEQEEVFRQMLREAGLL